MQQHAQCEACASARACRDRRAVILPLTVKGDRLVDRLMCRWREAIRAVMATMEPRQRRNLALAREVVSQGARVPGRPADELVLQLPT